MNKFAKLNHVRAWHTWKSNRSLLFKTEVHVSEYISEFFNLQKLTFVVSAVLEFSQPCNVLLVLVLVLVIM